MSVSDRQDEVVALRLLDTRARGANLDASNRQQLTRVGKIDGH